MVKKQVLFSAIFMTLILSTSPFVTAQLNNNSGNPFSKIWNAIEELEEEINNIWNSIFDLEEQIDNIELAQGLQGPPGANGTDGEDGKSAYQIWLDLGNNGTKTDFINSLTGPKGEKGEQGEQGPQGPPGISEVRIAVFNLTQQTQNGIDISCNSDEFATGGGTDSFGDTGNLGVLQFYPVNERTWHVEGGPDFGTVRLVCTKRTNQTAI